MNRFILLIVIILSTLLAKAQVIDPEIERFKGIKKIEVQSLNGYCAKKGYRALYTFNKKGQPIKLSNYFKRRLLAKFEFQYNLKDLLVSKIQTYSIDDKKNTDTTNFEYKFNSKGQLISKFIRYNSDWSSTYEYQDFDTNNLPKTYISIFNSDTTVIKKVFNQKGQPIDILKLENDSLITIEKRTYNQNDDLIYSIMPRLVDKKKDDLAIFIGGNRFSAIEEYSYTYDINLNWTEKFVEYEGTKILIEKRIYK